jgi:hypothetical protein
MYIALTRQEPHPGRRTGILLVLFGVPVVWWLTLERRTARPIQCVKYWWTHLDNRNMPFTFCFTRRTGLLTIKLECILCFRLQIANTQWPNTANRLYKNKHQRTFPLREHYIISEFQMAEHRLISLQTSKLNNSFNIIISLSSLFTTGNHGWNRRINNGITIPFGAQITQLDRLYLFV